MIIGSDVAKQAADIVLMDDNFASIIAGIEEGRLLFDNLRKTIAYTLTHLWPEVYTIMLNFFLGFPMGLTPLQVCCLLNSKMMIFFVYQILSIDLGTEVPPAVSLAYEPPERDIMTKPPRKRTVRLVSKGLLVYSYLFAGTFVSVGCAMAYFYTFWWVYSSVHMYSSIFRHHNIALHDLLDTAFQGNWVLGATNNFTSNGVVYDGNMQMDIKEQASAAWYSTIIMSQVWTRISLIYLLLHFIGISRLDVQNTTCIDI